ncbi:TlpA family protein disulfide reductase [Halonotius aquaticus]|uniref:TlpA family protein disulfide reductase n=1 Tax=Halonotius aquaticus TaxID=2216978 RepID=A0A3A6PTB2_9EURY|nr:TlpA disulfide reductase family protein [Halonotius aquaticus]RJX42751.1 TlpA family protein disulfide reductase [Halonotius aquaticus]
MNRRQVLTGLAGIGLTGGSLWVVRGNDTSRGDEFPITVETIDATGSTAGETTLPVADAPTLIDCFATWCDPCKKQFPKLAELHTEFGEAVAFVSVTNELIGRGTTKAELRRWWNTHGGVWPVGIDRDGAVLEAIGASSIPSLAVVDATGAIQWTDSGQFDVASLRTQLAAVSEST